MNRIVPNPLDRAVRFAVRSRGWLWWPTEAHGSWRWSDPESGSGRVIPVDRDAVPEDVRRTWIRRFGTRERED
ncbi:MAG TPA: hypothetical protein VIL45_07160 [Thermoplasmata archaeon]